MEDIRITPPTVLCIYPTGVLDRMRKFDESLQRANPTFDPDTARYFAVLTQTWGAGATVTVAFLGGDTALHRNIATAASTWSTYATLTFDFGLDPITGAYRTWSRSDTTYSADIRITFDEGGYWSVIGNQSRAPGVCAPNEASMCFSGFAASLPADWDGIVLHEFGHALGFQHEHQHPEGGCDSEYRWWDDPGYVITPLANPQNVPCVFASGDYIVPDANGRLPGLYRIMGGYKNYWSMCDIDNNIRQIENSSAYLVGPYDGESIMKYHFPAYMYRAGQQSSCYSSMNNTLSTGDQEGAERLYPREPEQVMNIANRMVALIDDTVSREIVGPDFQAFLEQVQRRFQVR